MAQLTIDQAFRLALQHQRAGRFQEAEQIYRQILAQQPKHSDALHLMGVIAGQTGRTDLAVQLIRQAIAINPNYPDAHSNLGNALRDGGQLDEAIAACRRAIALKPNYPEAHINLGNALRDKGQSDEAIAAYRKAISLEPDCPEAHSNLGNIMRDKGQLDEAIAAYRQAIALKPDYLEAHGNLASALLAKGDFTQGWEEYEWRWRCKDFPSRSRHFRQMQWDGSVLEGRRLLLHAEQGLGDALQFMRYLPLVIERGGKVIVECQGELRRLVQAMGGTFLVVVARGDSLPEFDVHCPLMSLPKVFGTTLKSIPRNVPYLKADAQEVEKWRICLAKPGAHAKVGLAWAGSAAHKNDRNRSVALAKFAPLARVPGVRFYSLQKSESGRVDALPEGMELIDLITEVRDFADTAALIANLDLVISVDTAVAHLAGAMGKAVWTLLPFVADWRWMVEREDSPWYPTMRLFRQAAIGDWGSVMGRVAEALAGQASGADVK